MLEDSVLRFVKVLDFVELDLRSGVSFCCEVLPFGVLDALRGGFASIGVRLSWDVCTVPIRPSLRTTFDQFHPRFVTLTVVPLLR